MNWRVANECAERRFGSAARKLIIMFLTDKASDDGSGIWSSKGTTQRHTELGESTVKRTINDFLREGIRTTRNTQQFIDGNDNGRDFSAASYANLGTKAQLQHTVVRVWPYQPGVKL